MYKASINWPPSHGYNDNIGRYGSTTCGLNVLVAGTTVWSLVNTYYIPKNLRDKTVSYTNPKASLFTTLWRDDSYSSCYTTVLRWAHLMSRGPADTRRLNSHMKNNGRTANNHQVTVGKFQLAMPVAVYNRVPIALLYTWQMTYCLWWYMWSVQRLSNWLCGCQVSPCCWYCLTVLSPY